jgi:tetratricopeptide (TPR) repeat protein
LIEKLILLNEDNRSSEAFSILDSADLKSPDSSELPFYRALLHEKRGELEAALSMLEISLNRDPESNYALNNKGNILMDLNRIDEALICFDTILQRAPAYTLAHYNRACVFSRQGKEQATLDELEFVLNHDKRLFQGAFTDPDFKWLINNPFFLKLTGLNKA